MVLLNALSSSVFLSNAAAATFYKDFVYAALFFALTITSIMFHMHDKNRVLYAIDQVVVVSLVIYGGYRLYTKGRITPLFWVAVATFLATVVFFVYGKHASQFCYHPQHGNEFHSVLHLISSVGHHAILFL